MGQLLGALRRPGHSLAEPPVLLAALAVQRREEDWWLGQAVAGLDEAPDELARRVDSVSVDDAVAAARELSLDTVYFLKGTEA